MDFKCFIDLNWLTSYLGKISAAIEFNTAYFDDIASITIFFCIN